MMTAEAVKTYAFSVNDDGSLTGPTTTTDRDSAGVEVDRLAKAFAAQFDVSYQTAFDAVRMDPQNRELIRTYALGG